MEAFIPMAVVVLIIFGVGMALLLSARYEKKRMAALREIGTRMGFDFLPQLDESSASRLKQLELFRRGRGNAASNYLRRATEDVEVLIFDHKYTTGGGKNSQTHRQSVVAIHSEQLDLPPFMISPEHFFHRLASALGFQDIDFAEHPRFSKKYLLRGADEQAIRDRLQHLNLERLADFDGLCIEAHHSQLLIWYAGKRRKPEELQSVFETAFELFVMFRD